MTVDGDLTAAFVFAVGRISSVELIAVTADAIATIEGAGAAAAAMAAAMPVKDDFVVNGFLGDGSSVADDAFLDTDSASDTSSSGGLDDFIEQIGGVSGGAGGGARGVNNGQPFSLVGGLVSYSPAGEGDDGDPVRGLIRRAPTALNLGLVQF